MKIDKSLKEKKKKKMNNFINIQNIIKIKITKIGTIRYNEARIYKDLKQF